MRGITRAIFLSRGTVHARGSSAKAPFLSVPRVRRAAAGSFLDLIRNVSPERLAIGNAELVLVELRLDGRAGQRETENRGDVDWSRGSSRKGERGTTPRRT